MLTAQTRRLSEVSTYSGLNPSTPPFEHFSESSNPGLVVISVNVNNFHKYFQPALILACQPSTLATNSNDADSDRCQFFLIDSSYGG